ncbi:hypothetical protein FRZ44_37820 [Hypericibacter terrae]|uniref:Uncharacterized protein n=1 Tax=Hypericibacter terrae TaxID=2602015 RepID=A0A5J6MPC1_9PROT|nr:hypothetical protein [Hypericibacter terrae]QEX18475.1 hypothetical protein FRZ44_37820 [Hypericibacter terrae]
MGAYNKAIVAFLGGAITLAGVFGLPTDWATPELVTAIGGVITTLLVYVVPNLPPKA